MSIGVMSTSWTGLVTRKAYACFNMVHNTTLMRYAFSSAALSHIVCVFSSASGNGRMICQQGSSSCQVMGRWAVGSPCTTAAAPKSM